jgi:DNA polymerase-4
VLGTAEHTATTGMLDTDESCADRAAGSASVEVPNASERPRKIIHIDMDAFYASVEQRDNPKLRGRPVAVGGSQERGVVAAASYEARRFGIHSAMASVTAKRKCPDLIFVKPRFDVYKAVSLQVRGIFAEYTTMIEPLSLDEAYLDMTENLKRIAYATQIAQEIRARISADTRLTTSAGVSYNKFLAKLASDQRKPDGMFVITPEMGPGFVETLPVGKFHGIGPATAAKMNALGIHTGADIKAQSLAFLQERSARPGATTIRSPAASTSARSGTTASASRSVPRTPSSEICGRSRTSAPSSSPSSTRSGAIAGRRASGAAPSP